MVKRRKARTKANADGTEEELDELVEGDNDDDDDDDESDEEGEMCTFVYKNKPCSVRI